MNYFAPNSAPASSRAGRAGRSRREARRLGGAVIAVGLYLGLVSWAAPPRQPTDQELKDAHAFFNEEKESEFNNVPNTGTIPDTIVVESVILAIYNDPNAPNVDERQQALAEAIKLMTAKGYRLPWQIDVLFSSTPVKTDWMAQAWAIHPTPSLAVLDRCPEHEYPRPDTNGEFASISAQVYDETYKASNSAKSWIYALCDTESEQKAQKAGCSTAVVHEICHLLHASQSPDDFYWNARKGQDVDPTGGWKEVSNQVSKYAGDKRNEFVAEVCAGLVQGYVYSAEVMQAYAALGGPVPGVAYDQPAPPP